MEEDEDRISQLPENILHHHILCRLSQSDAVRTSILSKSWRFLGPTRPKFEFHQSFMDGKKHKSLSVNFLENTLKRYYDQKPLISIHEFILGMSCQDPDPQKDFFLNKWIPIVIMNLGVKSFNLVAYNYSLPPVVLESEFLEKLFLRGCKFVPDKFNNNNNCIVKLQMLNRLELWSVCIDKETFEKIMSSCPLIQHLVLDLCHGLKAIKVNKARFLKRFVCNSIVGFDSIEIDDEATSLETISIKGGCKNWYINNNCFFFPRLKSLHLWEVHLPAELLNNLLSSNNCPCLEDLEIHYCSGFTEIELFSRSIKRVSVKISNRPIKAAIDAANMLCFEWGSNSHYLPSICFATSSNNQCKSRVQVLWRTNTDALHELLKAFSQSRISLEIYFPDLLTKFKDACDDGGCEPVVVEHLFLSGRCPSLAALLNCVFRICRPRYIGLSKVYGQLAEWETILKKGSENRQCHFWQQDLEESSIHVLDDETKEWRSGQVCVDEICFLLKWREI